MVFCAHGISYSWYFVLMVFRTHGVSCSWYFVLMVFRFHGILCSWLFSDTQTIVLVQFRAPKTCKLESNRVIVNQMFMFFLRSVFLFFAPKGRHSNRVGSGMSCAVWSSLFSNERSFVGLDRRPEWNKSSFQSCCLFADLSLCHLRDCW
jgi:hypothetical protein